MSSPGSGSYHITASHLPAPIVPDSADCLASLEARASHLAEGLNSMDPLVAEDEAKQIIRTAETLTVSMNARARRRHLVRGVTELLAQIDALNPMPNPSSNSKRAKTTRIEDIRRRGSEFGEVATRTHEVADFCDNLRRLCQSGLESLASSTLKREKHLYADVKDNILELMSERSIMTLVRHKENLAYNLFMDLNDVFASHMEQLPPREDIISTDSTGDRQKQVPWILDQSCREPATTTPYGHTMWTKYHTFRMMKATRLADIAVCGMYYGDQMTPEVMFLDLCKKKKLSLSGTWAMFGPSESDRFNGLAAMLNYGITNAFLDLTLKPSPRFNVGGEVDIEDVEQWTNSITETVLQAVHEVAQVFAEQGLPEVSGEGPWRDNEALKKGQLGSAEIVINLVDIMEYLQLNHGHFERTDRWERLKDCFEMWKQDPIFTRHVVGILTEEGRGMATHEDFRFLISELDKIFPFDPCKKSYRKLIHCHAGTSNSHDVASMECLLHGANGIWAAWIPHAAQSGHNCQIVFYDNLDKRGNTHIWEMFPRLNWGVEIARMMFYGQFNTLNIPENCPIWGGREQIVHTAFRTDYSGPEAWRSERRRKFQVDLPEDLKDQIHKIEDSLTELGANSDQEPTRRVRERLESRIAPLVSDDDTWKARLVDPDVRQMMQFPDSDADVIPRMRKLAYGILNANIRANFNEPAVLSILYLEAKRMKVDQKGVASSKTNH